MELTLKLEIPDLLNLNEFETKMILAGELYERRKLSLGQAAKLVGISKRVFIETMGDFGYSVFGKDENELLKDIVYEK